MLTVTFPRSIFSTNEQWKETVVVWVKLMAILLYYPCVIGSMKPLITVPKTTTESANTMRIPFWTNQDVMELLPSPTGRSGRIQNPVLNCHPTWETQENGLNFPIAQATVGGGYRLWKWKDSFSQVNQKFRWWVMRSEGFFRMCNFHWGRWYFRYLHEPAMLPSRHAKLQRAGSWN